MKEEMFVSPICLLKSGEVFFQMFLFCTYVSVLRTTQFVSSQSSQILFQWRKIILLILFYILPHPIRILIVLPLCISMNFPGTHEAKSQRIGRKFTSVQDISRLPAECTYFLCNQILKALPHFFSSFKSIPCQSRIGLKPSYRHYCFQAVSSTSGQNITNPFVPKHSVV